MGLDAGHVAFGELKGGNCGMVKPSLDRREVWTFYDHSDRCKAWSPRELALHEACHRRFKHLLVDHITDDQKHEEVVECARAYR